MQSAVLKIYTWTLLWVVENWLSSSYRMTLSSCYIGAQLGICYKIKNTSAVLTKFGVRYGNRLSLIVFKLQGQNVCLIVCMLT